MPEHTTLQHTIQVQVTKLNTYNIQYRYNNITHTIYNENRTTYNDNYTTTIYNDDHTMTTYTLNLKYQNRFRAHLMDF